MTIKEIKKEIDKLDRATLPELRKIAKKIVKDDYRAFLDNNPLDSFELKLLYAFTLGYAKDDIKTLIAYFEKFIPEVKDWAVCDALCNGFKTAKKHRAEVYEMLMKYKNSHNEFETRIVAVVLLSHYMVDDYIDRAIEVLNNLHTEAYYSKMGVAWAVAEVMVKYPEKCVEYLKSDDCKLDNWTYNKSLQKMRESFRVSDEIKEFTRTIKR
ncbi:MAG: DNA alkylation repair protein [Ruminococcus sp.]|nr:DNA alkylation repair protein [Ruminococcus sp.]